MALTKLSSKLTSFLNKLLPSAKIVSLYSRNASDASMFDFIPEEYHAGIMNHTETSDLSAYMQAAINDMDARGGGVIRVPPGQYYCNLVTKPHVVLIGARYNSTRRSLFWTYLVPSPQGFVITRTTGLSSLKQISQVEVLV